MSQSQQQDFARRVAQVSVSRGKPVVYAGPADTVSTGRAHRKLTRQAARIAARQARAERRRLRAGEGWPIVYNLLGLIGGFAAGVLALFLRFVSGTPGKMPAADMAMDSVIALSAALVLMVALRQRVRATLLPAILGVFMGLTLSHNVMHLWPAPFAQAFSGAFVRQMTAAAPMNSIRLAGTTYGL